MPSFTECRDIIVDNYLNPLTREKAIILHGQPGGAKTAMGVAVAKELGFNPAIYPTPGAQVMVQSPAFVNPVNLMGMPRTEDGMMVWSEPAVMHALSTGDWVYVIDEIGQCGGMMQSAIGSIMHTRGVNQVKLSPNVCVIGTTNRVEDKAGSKPLLTQLADRAMNLQMEYGHTDFIPHGIDMGWDPLGLAYIQFAPQHLFDFDPNRLVNSSARSWEYVLKVNPNQPKARYLATISGIIPEGIAADYVGFRDIVNSLPNPEEVRRNPATAPVPNKVNVQYALIANLLVNTQTVTEFEHIMQYIERLPTEFQTLYVHTCVKRVPMANQSPTYMAWIHKHLAVLGGKA